VEKRLDVESIGDPQYQLHQEARDAQWRERNAERIEVEKEEDARGALIDRQQKAPVLDAAARVRPLVRIVVAQLDEVGIDVLAIDKLPGDTADADLRLITQRNPVADAFAFRHLRIDEGPVLAVQVGMRQVADVVDDHRVMGTPGEVERYAGPGPGPLQLGD